MYIYDIYCLFLFVCWTIIVFRYLIISMSELKRVNIDLIQLRQLNKGKMEGDFCCFIISNKVLIEREMWRAFATSQCLKSLSSWIYLGFSVSSSLLVMYYVFSNLYQDKEPVLGEKLIQYRLFLMILVLFQMFWKNGNTFINTWLPVR